MASEVEVDVQHGVERVSIEGGQQGLGGNRGVGMGHGRVAATDGVGEACHPLLVVAEDPASNLGIGKSAADGDDNIDPGQLRLVLDEVCICLHQIHERLCPASAGIRLDRVDGVARHREHGLFFGVEQVVKAARSDSGLGTDAADRGCVHAQFPQKLTSGGQDPLSSLKARFVSHQKHGTGRSSLRSSLTEFGVAPSARRSNSRAGAFG